MTIRVYVGERDMMLGNISVAIVNHFEGTTGPGTILRFVADDLLRWDEFDPHSGEAVEPSFRLPGDAGRALLDALAHHYEGAEDTRRLRADYDAERCRVDAQALVIADVVRALTRKAGGS